MNNDRDTLLVISDWCEEHGSPEFAQELREIAARDKVTIHQRNLAQLLGREGSVRKFAETTIRRLERDASVVDVLLAPPQLSLRNVDVDFSAGRVVRKTLMDFRYRCYLSDRMPPEFVARDIAEILTRDVEKSILNQWQHQSALNDPPKET